MTNQTQKKQLEKLCSDNEYYMLRLPGDLWPPFRCEYSRRIREYEQKNYISKGEKPPLEHYMNCMFRWAIANYWPILTGLASIGIYELSARFM